MDLLQRKSKKRKCDSLLFILCVWTCASGATIGCYRNNWIRFPWEVSTTSGSAREEKIPRHADLKGGYYGGAEIRANAIHQ